MELGSGRRCGDRGVEEGAALRDLGSALRHEPPQVLRRQSGVAPGRPYVRLANVEGAFGHKLAKPDLISSAMSGAVFHTTVHRTQERVKPTSTHVSFKTCKSRRSPRSFSPRNRRSVDDGHAKKSGTEQVNKE